MSPLNALTREDLPLLKEFREVGLLQHREADFASHSTSLSLPFIETLGKIDSMRDLAINIVSDVDLGLPFQWSHLTVLKLSVSRSSLGCVSFVQRVSQLCPLLVECTLLVPYRDTTIDPLSTGQHQVSQEWAHLRKLDITLSGPSNSSVEETVFHLFESITTPSLTHLSLCLNCFPVPGHDAPFYHSGRGLSFHNLIARSHCKLTELDLNIPLPESLGDTLDLLPSLTALTLDTVPSDDETSFDLIFRTLTSHPARCRNVRTLAITSCHPRDSLPLVDLIESRRRDSDLTLFRANFATFPSSSADIRVLEVALEVAKSRELGVDIRWEYVRQNFPDIRDSPYPFIESPLDVLTPTP
ncbi:hypothetical protein AAF712_015572 [Marasmius tenuissimus]|uniref:F-box protein n=1 Tax=Marasmius tenuissimus TaxID=585030 RepID=A0ABR2Z7W9_9AGAR